jgi:hypothetical protein
MAVERITGHFNVSFTFLREELRFQLSLSCFCSCTVITLRLIVFWLSHPPLLLAVRPRLCRILPFDPVQQIQTPPISYFVLTPRWMCLPRYVRRTIVSGRNLKSVRLPEEFRITAFDLLLTCTRIQCADCMFFVWLCTPNCLYRERCFIRWDLLVWSRISLVFIIAFILDTILTVL